MTSVLKTAPATQVGAELCLLRWRRAEPTAVGCRFVCHPKE